MEDTEQVIWVEKAGMADFLVYPPYWIYTILSFSLFFFYTYLVRYYTRYTLTNERLIKEWGILIRGRDEVELYRIKDSRVVSGLFQRIVKYGDIYISSTDATEIIYLKNIPNAMSKREQIRAMANKSRESVGVRTIINE